MRKVLSLTLALAMVLSLSSCGGQNGGTSAPSASSTPSASSAPAASTADGSAGANASSSGGSGMVEVDSGLFNVTITVPATFMGEDATQESLDATAKEKGYKSITLNEDGSATYVMSKAKHKEMMDELRQQIDDSLEEMISSGTYPDVVSASVNKDITKFTIKVNTEELSMETSLLSLGCILIGGMYHAFNGVEPDDIIIQYVNADTGEVIEEGSLNALEESNSEDSST